MSWTTMKNAQFATILFYTLFLVAGALNAQENSGDSATLNASQQSIVAVSALTATGNVRDLNIQLAEALDAGLTVNELTEIVTQLYAYCGFPRSLNAITALMQVLEERKAKGIKDQQGKTMTAKAITADRYEQGRKVLEELTKTTQPKPAPGFGGFAPRIDAFLKEHLFADIFASDVLTYQQRELATISALAAMPGVAPQLQAHIKMGMNTGITKSQLIAAASVVEKSAGVSQANVLRMLLSAPISPVLALDLMVRIAEIEIFPEHVEQYKAILKEESEISVRQEPGVIAIFPVYQKENPAQFRLVEIYATDSAYRSHLQTPQFQQYKTTTLKMVKSLKLVEMEALDREMMQEILRKVK